MRITLLLLLTLCFSCKSMKTDSFEKSINQNIALESACKNSGECSVEVMENMSLLLQKDNANMLFPEFVTNTSSKVIKFTYTKKMAQEAADAQYKEEVIFEIPSQENTLFYENDNLQKVKLIHGRFCYCKGAAGYFKITEGTLSIKNGKLQLDFKNNDVPQIIDNLVLSY